MHTTNLDLMSDVRARLLHISWQQIFTKNNETWLSVSLFSAKGAIGGIATDISSSICRCFIAAWGSSTLVLVTQDVWYSVSMRRALMILYTSTSCTVDIDCCLRIGDMSASSKIYNNSKWCYITAITYYLLISVAKESLVLSLYRTYHIKAEVTQIRTTKLNSSRLSCLVEVTTGACTSSSRSVCSISGKNSWFPSTLYDNISTYCFDRVCWFILILHLMNMISESMARKIHIHDVS